MPGTYTRTCNICGREFIRDYAGRKARICSEECRKIVRAQNAAKTTKRTERVCQRCGKTFQRPPCRKSKYCSQECHYKHMHITETGKTRTSRAVPCDYCGEPVRKFKSHIEARGHAFCNNQCYHEWDSWYKSQPEQQRKQAIRMAGMSRKTSKVEDMVAAWLDTHAITYERQAPLIHRSMDFRAGDAYIEVQGCYWHGCPDCFILQTPKQRKVMSRDKAKVTYCQRRGIPLYIIWEHDVRAGNFAALAPLLSQAA